MPAQAPRVVRVVTFARGGEEREVPVLGHVPVEGVEGVEEDEEEPEPEEAGFAEADFGGVVPALQRAEDDDREGAGVFERVGEVLAAPAQVGGLGASAHPGVFDEALPESDDAWDTDDQGHEVLSAAVAVRFIRRRHAAAEEHACGDKEVAEHFGVRCQDVGE